MAHWAIEKRIPQALLVTLAFAILGFAATQIGWATTIDHRVATVEATQADRAPLVERFIATEQALKDLKEIVVDTNHKVDRLLERRDPPP